MQSRNRSFKKIYSPGFLLTYSCHKLAAFLCDNKL